MININEIIARFKIKIPPEKQLQEAIYSYFDEKKVPRQEIKVSLQQQKVFIQCDPYLKLFIKTKEQEILFHLKQRTPHYKVNRII